MLIVSDTSALSALAKMDWLGWLRQRWGHVAVPEAVWREVSAIDDAVAYERLAEARQQGWLSVHPVTDRTQVADLAERLDPGESESIVLAVELDAAALLIDEKDGRDEARKRRLATTGTLGLIVWAKRNGLIGLADETVEALVSTTRFYVSDTVRREIRRLAGEDG